jgi:hypothetical protein
MGGEKSPREESSGERGVSITAERPKAAHSGERLHGGTWAGTSLRQRSRNALGLPRTTPEPDEVHATSPPLARSYPSSPTATRVPGKTEDARRHSGERQRSLGEFESLSSRSSQSSGALSPGRASLHSELIPENAPVHLGLPPSLFDLDRGSMTRETFLQPSDPGSRMPPRRTRELSHEHVSGADMEPTARISGSEAIPRMVTDDPTYAHFTGTPRLGSFEASAGSIARSLDSWRPALSSEEVFCDIDGLQVRKLERLIGVLRTLVPEDGEQCTILGNELRAALEHRGLRAEVQTVMHLLEEAEQVEWIEAP